jgi:hypothetical protein
MPWKSAQYDQVRKDMKPGDVIAFAGDGPVSEIIMRTTLSNVSHVGAILRSEPVAGEPQPGFFQVIESTSLDGSVGVTISLLSERIQSYDGKVWWLPLSDSVRKRMDVEAFRGFLLQQEGKPYDVPQAIMSGLDQLDDNALFERATHADEDFSRFFCSELVAAAFEASGAIRHLNASEVTPIDLCMFSIYKPDYYQLKGGTEIIGGHNTLSPEGWGE